MFTNEHLLPVSLRLKFVIYFPVDNRPHSCNTCLTAASYQVSLRSLCWADTDYQTFVEFAAAAGHIANWSSYDVQISSQITTIDTHCFTAQMSCYRPIDSVTALIVPQHWQCHSTDSATALTVSQHWQCHSTDSATALTVSQHWQCHSTDSVTALTVSQHWQCHSTDSVIALTVPQHWQCHSTDSVTALTVPHHRQCHITDSVTALRVSQHSRRTATEWLILMVILDDVDDDEEQKWI